MQESSRTGCDNAREGGIGDAFSSPAVSRSAVDKAGMGRSRPRLVKVRKQLNSHNGRLGPGSLSEAKPIDSEFNPFPSGFEISDKLQKSVSTSNGFSNFVGNEKFENVGFGFSRKGDDWMSSSCSSEFGGSVGKLGLENFVKLENLGFVFGANKCDSRQNMGSGKIRLAESVGKMDANDTGKLNMEYGESAVKFGNKCFVFGGKRDSGLNLNLGQGESDENFMKPDDMGNSKIEQEAVLSKFGDVNFLFGAHYCGLTSSSNLEKRRNMETLKFDDISKRKMLTEVECGQCHEVGLVSGMNMCDLENNSNSQNAKFMENEGKLCPDETITKIRSDQSKCGKYDGLGFVPGDSPSNSNLEKKTTDYSGTELSDKETMYVHIETNFMKTKPSTFSNNNIGNGSLNLDEDYKNGVFVFGSRSKKSPTSDQNTIDNFACRSSSFTSAPAAVPLFKLPSELKKLNINANENVDDADKTRDSNVCFSAAQKTIVFGNNRQSFGFPTEKSAATSHDWINKARMDGCENSDTLRKTNTTDVKTSGNENFIFGSTENIVSSSGGDESRGSNKGNGLRDFSEKQSVNTDAIRFLDPATSDCNSLPYQRSEVGHILQGHAKNDIKLNGAAAPSSSSHIGLGFQPFSGVSEASSLNKFSFVIPPDGEPFTDFKTTRWDVSCSFTSEQLPGLNKKMDFCAKSRSFKDKRSKKTRGRHPIVAKRSPQTDFVQKENSSQENPDSPELYSPMDFSPYQEPVANSPCSYPFQPEINDAPSAIDSIFPNDAKADLAASGEGLDFKEGQEICREPKAQSSECHIATGIDDLNSSARGEFCDPETNQENSSSSASVASAGARAGFSSDMERQESDNRIRFFFASDFENISGKKFTFSALSSAKCSTSAKHQTRKKNRMKVDGYSFVITPSLDVNLGSSSVPFSPLSSTPLSVGMVEGKKENVSISQNKWKNRSDQDGEQIKQRSTAVSAALLEACEKWRLRYF